MSPTHDVAVVLVPDRGEPLDRLERCLTAAEIILAAKRPTERTRRQFAIGRVAARSAVNLTRGCDVDGLEVEVVSGRWGEPLALVEGKDQQVGVSLAHSGPLAVACAWRAGHNSSCGMGVDLERVRATEVERSEYAFSAQELRLLGRSPEGAAMAGLAGWIAKEAAWKALRLDGRAAPLELVIVSLCLSEGVVEVAAPPGLGHLAPTPLAVLVSSLAGPDGLYLLALTETTAGRLAKPWLYVAEMTD